MHVTLSIWQALLIALWVALVESRILGFSTLTMRFSPLMTGMMVGFIMGDIKQAMIVTAAIQLVYMGFVAPGGALPAEPCIATAIAVPVALLGHMSPQGAIAIAVPVGLLGSYLYQFRFFLNTFALKPMDKYAREGNARGLGFAIMGIPTLISFALFIPLMFIALYFGAPVISGLVANIEHGTLIHVLNSVGGGLAALGIAVIMQVIGKKQLLPFFFLAYFMSVAFAKLDISMTIYAIFGAIFAILYVTFTSKNQPIKEVKSMSEEVAATNADVQAPEDAQTEDHRIPQPDKITNKDLMKSWFGWWWANEVPHTFDRMLAPAFCFGLIPTLKKLYKDKAELAKAFQRHLLFFNTQATWGGGTLTGVTISLEEARAKALANGEEPISEDMINNTKVGLMGPLAGIGDSIDSGTVQYIFIAIFLPFAQKGNFMGALLPFLCFAIATFTYGYYFTKMGYSLGRAAAKEIMTGGRMAGIIDGLGVLGLYMMGILAGQYIKIQSYLKFTISKKTFDVQDILNTILPGILPLFAVLMLYWYFQKQGLKITRGLVYLTIALVVLSIFYII